MIELFFELAAERELITKRRNDGLPQPKWTENQVFKELHFPSVLIEDSTFAWDISNRVMSRLEGKKEHVLMSLCVMLKQNCIESYECFQHRAWPEVRNEFLQQNYAILPNLFEVRMALFDKVHKSMGNLIWRKTCMQMFHGLIRSGLSRDIANLVVVHLKHSGFLQGATDRDLFHYVGGGARKGLDLIFRGKYRASLKDPRLYGEVMYLLNKAPEGWVASDITAWLRQFNRYHRFLEGERVHGHLKAT